MALLQSLLGLAVGVVLTMCVYTSINRARKLREVRYNSWQKLNVILKEVQKNYVDTVDVKGVTDAAVVAALSKLDPHSIYLPPAELETSETELAGNFDGIGIQFNVPNDTAIVLEVIPGGPSEKAGLLPGDRILKVGDKVIAGVGFPQDSMVRRMKGHAGTKVKILIGRDGTQIPFDITRDKIPVHCVDASFMVNDEVGYIRLSKFTRTTFTEVSEASEMLLSQGMKKLLFDLRDNTGGFLDQALLLSNMFLEKNDTIVYINGLHRRREDFMADGRGTMKQLPLGVLINETTASSSEIFAGAIQDNDRGLIIGRRSFGKGLVQEPINFTDGSGIRITVARFYTPSGRCIQKPYGDYDYDIYKRWTDGEMFAKDSIKVDSSKVYKTSAGRTVYGGGGIIPDVFVPADTTHATSFYVKCNKKATAMRYASMIFDTYKSTLGSIDSYPELERFLSGLNIPSSFVGYAALQDGIRPSPGEWQKTEPYMLPQLKALIARYSRLGDNAFYKFYLPVDDVVNAALEEM